MADKISLASILNGFNLANINSNFQKLEAYINDRVLSRDIDTGQANEMRETLDMNSNRIINVPPPTLASEAVNKAYVDQLAPVDTSQRVNTVQEVIVATEGQTIFTLNQTYAPGSLNLDVYINGVHQGAGGYTESSSNVVTFSEGLEAGDRVLFKINQRTVSTDALSPGAVVAALDGQNLSLGSVTTTDVQTGVDAGDTVEFKAFDVDSATYATFATLTANDTPTFDLSPSTTMDGKTILTTGQAPDIASRIIVTTANFASTLGGTIDSTKEYYLDGIVDPQGVSIEIPAGGLTIRGASFDISGIVDTTNSYTMFTSPAGGSGNLLMTDVYVQASGTGSQIFDIFSDDGFKAVEMNRVNFIACTSLGTIDNYRQGLESGTGRFAGTPSLTLAGTWVGGYRITTSIVRSLSSGMTDPLFKAGTGFSMNSRFLTDINCDLPTSAAFCDFLDTQFPNPSTVQVRGAIFTRNGVTDAEDPNIFPNIKEAALCSDWQNNNGLKNTFEGGVVTVGGQTATAISTAGTWETLHVGTAPVESELVHYDTVVVGNGLALRHLGNSPREYRFVADLIIEGSANRELEVAISKYDDSAGTTTLLTDTVQVRTITNSVGGRDVALFNKYGRISLDQNDYAFLSIRNLTDTTNVTVEDGSRFTIEEA